MLITSIYIVSYYSRAKLTASSTYPSARPSCTPAQPNMTTSHDTSLQYNDLPLVPPPTSITATPTPFPARTKQNARVLDGLRTDVAITQFTDKILVTIVQEGDGLGHFVSVTGHSGTCMKVQLEAIDLSILQAGHLPLQLKTAIPSLSHQC